MSGDITISPEPPEAGGTVTITVPHDGPWEIFVTDASTGAVTSLGPLSAGGDQSIEVVIPSDAGGDTLTITDMGEPTPQDADYQIISTN